MRKNIAKVIKAFKEGRAVKGDSKGTCYTDGRNVWSYNMLIAKRFTDNYNEDMIVIIDPEYAPSTTTRSQIRALMTECPQSGLVREGSCLTWDFKFNKIYSFPE